MPTLRDADPRHLAALLAVVEHGTFAKAATSLGFTQSAVSQQIASLEKAAGVAVFDRPKGPRPAELTHAGRIVVGHARTILAEIARMDGELDRVRRGITGRLVIGTFQSVSAELLPTIVGRMRADAPDVAIDLTEIDDNDELLRGVLDDDMDMAFTVDVDPDDRLDITTLGQDPFVVLAPADHEHGTTATADDLNAHPLIGQPDNDTCQLMIDRRLAAAGIEPDYDFRFKNNGAVQSMVRAGMGWAVMPYLAIDPDDRGVAVLALEPPIAPRTVQLVRRAGRTLLPASDAFTAIALATGAELLRAPPVDP